ncbi:MAG: hypothetical protein QOG87_2857 [Actinomycetota bacterium]|jgi:uncharacterized membrane protein YdbT with pleckstrin-like domain
MPFPRKFLNDEEDIVLDLHPHWWFLFGPIVAVVLTSVAGVFLGRTDNTVLGIAGLVLMGVALLWLGVRYLKWRTTNFVLTTDRLIHRAGVLAKQGREIPLERINDLTVNQSIFERIIRAGDVMIESGGERGQSLLSDLPNPFKVQNAIYAEIERTQARTADRTAGRRELSVPEQIEKLDELRQRGLISNAEFDAKKAQLLDRM